MAAVEPNGCLTSCGFHLKRQEHCLRGDVEPTGTPRISVTSHHRERAMTARDKDLNDLFLDTLKDIYFAEKQIL
ncbi:MAG: hypothetical protein ACREDY_10690, partial [Bradyrhizobium sp.]